MDYIYKIVDKVELDYAKDGILSLSHPIFEFKGSEGKFINFAKSIYDKYKKNDKCLDIKPSETDLKKIKEWIDVYKKTYGPDFKDVDNNSESMIIFCDIDGVLNSEIGTAESGVLGIEEEKTLFIAGSTRINWC